MSYVKSRKLLNRTDNFYYMKMTNKFGLFFISILLLSIFTVSVFAESCQVARPWYGSVNCKEEGTWSDPVYKYDGGIYQCDVENCRIANYDNFNCNVLGTLWKGLSITKNDTTILECSASYLSPMSCTKGNVPLAFYKGDVIKIDFWCSNGITSYNPSSDNPKVEIRYMPIKLELNFDSGYNFIDNTEFCDINPIWNSYGQKQPSNPSQLQSMNVVTDLFSQNSGTSIPSDTLGVLTPKKLEVGQGYWLVYDWVTRPDLIVKQYQNMPVWCNPADHSLTKFEEVKTQSDSCYYIPTQRLSQKVDCCNSDECKMTYNEQSILCTDDFKCGYEKSCLSDFDCGAVSQTCQKEGTRYYTVKAFCDKSKLDSYGNGKCSSSKQEVKCCTGQDGGPNTCGSGMYCKYDEGCIKILLDCPSGMCCNSGGDYKQATCPSNLKCCPTSDPIIGECKESCEPPPKTTDTKSTQTGGLSSASASPTGLLTGPDMGTMAYIIGIVIAIAAAGVIFYFSFMRKSGSKAKDEDDDLFGKSGKGDKDEEEEF